MCQSLNDIEGCGQGASHGTEERSARIPYGHAEQVRERRENERKNERKFEREIEKTIIESSTILTCPLFSLFLLQY